MKTRIFYKQMGRSLRTLLINGVILLVVTAFFVMSLNLYNSSVENLKLAEDTYSTIAVMELYGDIDSWGNLTSMENEHYRGYHSVGVDDYDFSRIVSAAGVTGHELRTRYAAYIKGEPAISDRNVDVAQTLMIDRDIIRFTLEKDEPVTIPISWAEDYWDYCFSDESGRVVFLTIQDSAAEQLLYLSSDFLSEGISMGEDPADRDYYAQQVKQLNRSEETDYVTLYPGVEYIASSAMAPGWEIREFNKTGFSGPQIFSPDYLNYFNEDFRMRYSNFGEEWVDYKIGREAGQPFPIARWEDVQKDPALKGQWEAAWETLEYNMCSYSICLTDDIAGVPLFHLGGALIDSGRMITPEEYASGAKVCMVSKKMAELQNWYVGKKLDMSLYQFEAYPNANDLEGISNPIYHKNTEGFFDSGVYEIVGIFDRKNLAGNSGIAESTLSLPWDQIFLPRNSVQNTPKDDPQRVHAALLTIWLENGSIDTFLEDLDARGITAETQDSYQPTFTFFDQGYSIVQPGLQNMKSTAELLLILSALLLAITCVLLAYFFAQNQKHTIGIFRMLGGKQKQAMAAVLICAMLITIVGAAVGAFLGHSLSRRVGETLLTNDIEETEEMAAIRAYVLATGENDGMELVVEADAVLSALGACASLLFPLLMLLFVLGYIHKEPRALLPQNKA